MIRKVRAIRASEWWIEVRPDQTSVPILARKRRTRPRAGRCQSDGSENMDRRAPSVLVDRAVDAPEESNANHVRRRAIFIIDADADARQDIETRLATLRLTNPTVGLADGEHALQALRHG